MSRPAFAYLIRRDRPEDAPVLAELLSHPAIFETAGHAESLEAEGIAEFISERDESEAGLVAEFDGAVIAWAILSRSSPHPRRAHAAALSVAVAPRHQRRGVARELLSGLIRLADEGRRVTRLELHVFDCEQASVELYRQLGFQIEGSMEGHTTLRGEPARVLMMARLAPPPLAINPLR